MEENAFTKAELVELWGRSGEEQQDVCLAKVMEALVRTDGDIVLSFSGGKDSTYLAYRFCQAATVLGMRDRKFPFAFANTTNETKAMHKHIQTSLDFLRKKFGMELELLEVKPTDKQTWVTVAREKGIPFPTKSVAGAVRKIRKDLRRKGIRFQELERYAVSTPEARDTLRSMGLGNTAVYYLTGWSCQSGCFSSRFKLPRQWYPLLWEECPVEVSEECCAVLKERPLQRLSYPNMMTAEMAEESASRELEFLKHGCNPRLPGGRFRSKPMGCMTQQGVLYGIRYFDIPLCSDYGEIVEEGGVYRCTGAQRTGCALCGFGLKFDTGRFVRLERTEPEKVRFAFKPLEKGGLGYRELIGFSNEHCHTRIQLPRCVEESSVG